jgi:catechol 2,3-dioxygenase-like lactoylglutathione lyase family enzyme
MVYGWTSSEPAQQGRSFRLMLHHVSLGTSNLERAETFYDAVMREVGLSKTLRVDEAVGYGAGITVFSLNLPADGGAPTPGNGVHIAVEVEKRSAVDGFFRAALANGGSPDGEPGLRPSMTRTTTRRSCVTRTATRSRR